MVVSATDFFVTTTTESTWGAPAQVAEELDRPRVQALIEAPEAGQPDLDVALALMDLVRDDLTLFGTSGGEALSDDDMRLAVRALQRVTERAGHAVKLPFRDHSSWKTYWLRNDGYGSWQARRELLGALFDEPYAAMMAAQDRALDSTLVEPVSPRERLGWPAVDTEIGELRRHFRSATTPQDYRAVGNGCVHLTEALSRQVYVHARHTPAGEPEPPVDKTKMRLDRYIEERLPGPDNAAMRKFARGAIELAQAVKHSGTPTRKEAGVLADAVVCLANLLRRLDEE